MCVHIFRLNPFDMRKGIDLLVNKSHKSEPRFGGEKGALQRAGKRRSCAAKSVGGTVCRPRSGSQKDKKSCLGVSIQPRSNIFYNEPVILSAWWCSAPPASANAPAATSQKFSLTIFLLRAPLKKILKRKGKFLLCSALNSSGGRGYQRSDSSGWKFLDSGS